jgi:hypothetical protein
MKIYVHLRDLAKLLLEWRMFQTKVVEKIETNFMPLFFLNRAFYKTIRKNMVQPNRPQIQI